MYVSEFQYEMPSGGMPSLPEIHAAEALLELQKDYRANEIQRSHPEFYNEMESTATEKALSSNRLIGSNISASSNAVSPSTSGTKVVKLNEGFIIRNNGMSWKEYETNDRKRQRLNKKQSREQISLSDADKPHHNGEIKKTCEMGTQTEIEYQLPQIEKMETIITELCEKIRLLEEQLKNQQAINSTIIGEMKSETNISGVDEENYQNDHIYSSRKSYDRKAKISTSMTFDDIDEVSGDESDSEYKMEDVDVSEDDYFSDEQEYKHTVMSKSNVNTSVDMVPIGNGHASVPSRLLRQLDWSSYTNVTRKLLTAVFSRRILATHSLTGKPSPAFPDKPAKKKLDPALVNDIIQTVVDKCLVPENVVRTSITTKCADESKMFRTRQQNKIKRKSFKKENIPPTMKSKSPISQH